MLSRVCGCARPQLIINVTEIHLNANWPETRKPFLANTSQIHRK
jgi:hypothetical protein